MAMSPKSANKLAEQAFQNYAKATVKANRVG